MLKQIGNIKQKKKKKKKKKARLLPNLESISGGS
jgi:hypothetical protein